MNVDLFVKTKSRIGGERDAVDTNPQAIGSVDDPPEKGCFLDGGRKLCGYSDRCLVWNLVRVIYARGDAGLAYCPHPPGLGHPVAHAVTHTQPHAYAGNGRTIDVDSNDSVIKPLPSTRKPHVSEAASTMVVEQLHLSSRLEDQLLFTGITVGVEQGDGRLWHPWADLCGVASAMGGAQNNHRYNYRSECCNP